MEKTHPLKEFLGTSLRHLWDLMVLNWMWFLCSLPIITIGPATCAMYACTLKLSKDYPVNPARDFLAAFRSNFRPALVLGLLAGVIAVVAAGDIWFALQQTGSLQTLYLVIGILLATVFLTIASYAFALQSLFENPLKVQLANAFKLAFVAPGKTVSLWMITILPVLVLVALPISWVAPVGFLYIMLGASGPAYLNAKTLHRVFDKVNGSPVIPD